MRPVLTLSDYINGLTQGNIAMLSKAITLIESTLPQHQEMARELIDRLLPMTGNSMRLGITGVPGVGKSTFIESYGMHLITQGEKVAVLAIDPSSSISKGSILGDKTRMEKLSVHPRAFIRPSAARGSLGGVTYKTKEATLLCEAAGFTSIIIETVGVGQSETEVSQITDFFLLLMLSGAGDELQGIKRGIMEMADGLVITKADGPNIEKAKIARSEYARALHFLPPHPSGWIPEVKICSAYEDQGIKEVALMVEKFRQHQLANSYFYQNRNAQNLHAFRRLFNEQMHRILMARPGFKEKINSLETEIQQGHISPYTAVTKAFETE